MNVNEEQNERGSSLYNGRLRSKGDSQSEAADDIAMNGGKTRINPGQLRVNLKWLRWSASSGEGETDSDRLSPRGKQHSKNAGMEYEWRDGGSDWLIAEGRCCFTFEFYSRDNKDNTNNYKPKKQIKKMTPEQS